MAANDTGTTQYDLFKARGRHQHGERYYDTVDGIAREWIKQNPNRPKELQTHEQVQDWIIKTNKIKDPKGRDCAGEDRNNALIIADRDYKLPEGNEITNPRMAKETSPKCNVLSAPSALRQQLQAIANTTPIMPYEEAPRIVVKDEPARIVDLAARAKLPEFPDLETPKGSDRLNIHTAVMNAPMLLGHMPDQPEIAARGRHRNDIPWQTGSDVGRSALSVLLYAPVIPLGAVGLVPTRLDPRDGAERIQNALQGSNGMDGNSERARGGVYLDGHDQWPFNGSWNPVASGPKERRDSTLLPGLGVEVNAQGSIVTAEATVFPNNHLYATNGGTPSVTNSQVGVDSNYTEKNKWSWGAPSAPVELLGTTNYAMAAYVNQQSIEPQIKRATDAYEKSPSKATAQKMIDLLNYQSTLVGISNYPVNADMKQSYNAEQFAKLNPAEQIAYKKAIVVNDAASKGITGLDINHLPAETPVRSVNKAQMREQLVAYYDKLAEEKPGAFEKIYEEKELLGKANERDLKDKDQRRAAAEEFVEALPFYKSYPENGVALKGLDRHVSTRDPKNPTDLSKHNFNAIEQSELRPKRAPAKNAMDAAMGLIAGDAALTSTVLDAAGTNRKLAEAIAQRDLAAINLPAELGEHKMRWTRDNADIKARGYSDEVMATAFTTNPGQGIVRGDVDRIGSQIAGTANDPVVVALRQRDFADLKSDGMKDDPRFPVGSLQSQTLYALATEEGNKTLKALEAKILAANPQDAQAQIQTLREGVAAAKNYKSANLLGGITHDNLMTYVSAQTVASAAEAGVPLERRVDTVIDTKLDAARAKAVMSHIAQSPDASTALLSAQAASGQSKTSETVLDVAAKLPDAERVAVAKAALTELRGNSADAVRVRASLFADQTVDHKRLDSLKPGKLNAADAAYVLTALKAGDGEKLALAGIAKDGKASTALVGALSAQSPELIASITKEIGDAGAVAVGSKVGMRSEQVSDLTTTRKTNHPVMVRKEIDVKDFVEAAKTADATSRSGNVASTFFTNPATQTRALEALATSQPDYIQAVTVHTLSANPELVKPALDALRKQGASTGMLSSVSKFFNQHPQGKLAAIVEGLTTAQQTGNAEAAAQYANQFNSFVAASNTPEGKGNAVALAGLVTATANATSTGGVTGQQALTSTITTAISNSIAGQANPLPTSSLTPQATLTAIGTAVVTADPAKATEIANAGITVTDNLPTTPGFVIPWVIVPLPRSKPNDNPEIPDVEVPGCDTPSDIPPLGCGKVPGGASGLGKTAAKVFGGR